MKIDGPENSGGLKVTLWQDYISRTTETPTPQWWTGMDPEHMRFLE